ncbi:semaphorin-5B-like, partial [Scleropages formosus]
ATEWGPDEDTRRSCQSKGKTEVECQNYIRVLLINGKQLFTCGTNAFMPICTTRQVGNMSRVLDKVNGVARCPYDPRHNSTAVMTEKGELYAATVIDFSGRDPVIYRSLGNMPPLRTAQYNSKWLNEPHFISAYDVGLFTYFFLRENAAFNGPFRSQENPRSTWLPTPNPIPNFQCGTVNDSGPNVNLTERSLQDAQRLFLMNDVVQPVSIDPLVMQDNMRFSKLVVDIVQGRDTLYHVMYIGTEYGTILKALSTANKSLQGCYLEEIQLLPTDIWEPILSLQILHSDRSLFVGLNNRVLKIPLERCSSYRTEQVCLDARDPYCGWDRKQKRCTTIEDSSNMSQWSQNITVCPLRNLTVDGGFGPWAQWQPCNHEDGDSTSACMCRLRPCNSPTPRCGGRNCEGPTMQEWRLDTLVILGSVQYQLWDRVRGSPAFLLCNEKVSCPLPVLWSIWGSWTKCSSECGGGVHSRIRSCENGNSCPGCALEYKTCNLEACPEVRRNTPWTPWMPVNVTQGGARQEQRMRYTCRAQLADPHELQFGKRKVETRFCPNDGSSACETDSLVEDLLKTGRPMMRGVGATWSPWETWSTCSQECAMGFRTRKRTCATPEGKTVLVACSGSPVEYQECNPQACSVKGGWSCWSSWSQCSVTCDGGHYQRTRSCTNPAPTGGGDICIGLHTEEALCNTNPCKGGWTAWSGWGPCEDTGLQLRSRTCQDPGTGFCPGNGTERRDCLSSEVPVILPASGFDKNLNCGAFTLPHLIATGVSCFLGTGLLSFLLYIYCQRFHKPSQESAVIHPTTPNHLTYKGNSTPKNEKYTPMEFKTLNKNNLLPDERTNFFPSPLQQTNVYTTTYYPTTLNKYDYRPDSSPSPCRTYTPS